ncbi:hypothetical protein M430DRAFT_259228 [Amorphotheca resinae ATCC 22711]|uniref:Uncharacterized protein n=1 Tax=Amorphotheca resinae ATCC 22711 TaxID=857342 RepID=A0A2T3AYZ0_AMORE|nr:hypothetical protein M430DRAFT_259228 [Amorphotheca resinae ATCC 22711]PSS15284.1 hypothetical protein M430DRAFT_259228 [Amorphotheca resinae ATCC 22711]
MKGECGCSGSSSCKYRPRSRHPSLSLSRLHLIYSPPKAPVRSLVLVDLAVHGYLGLFGFAAHRDAIVEEGGAYLVGFRGHGLGEQSFVP